MLARILVDRGLAGTRVGARALSSAAVADVAAWSLLAVVVGLSGGKPAWSLLAVPAVLAMVFLVRPRAAGRALLGGGLGSADRGAATWITDGWHSYTTLRGCGSTGSERGGWTR